MTTTNAELRALAEKATSGEWEISDKHPDAIITPNNRHERSRYPDTFDWYGGDPVCESAEANDAAYIAAAHPARIISLLDELTALRDENEYLREQRDNLQATTTYEALEAKFEAAEHQIHRLERELEENFRRMTLISETSANRQTKLDIAIEALEWIDQDYVGNGHLARKALAQLKEQP